MVSSQFTRGQSVIYRAEFIPGSFRQSTLRLTAHKTERENIPGWLDAAILVTFSAKTTASPLRKMEHQSRLLKRGEGTYSPRCQSM